MSFFFNEIYYYIFLNHLKSNWKKKKMLVMKTGQIRLFDKNSHKCSTRNV